MMNERDKTLWEAVKAARGVRHNEVSNDEGECIICDAQTAQVDAIFDLMSPEWGADTNGDESTRGV